MGPLAEDMGRSDSNVDAYMKRHAVPVRCPALFMRWADGFVCASALTSPMRG